MNRDDILAIYAAGPDAVCDLVEALITRLDAQQEQLTHLTETVRELEARLAQDSHNSSKPPSSDGPRTPPKPQSLRQHSGKKPGGQVGHPGHSLRMTTRPDRVLRHRPDHCAACGGSLADVPASSTVHRQVHDVPPVRLEVVEHQADAVQCPHCQTTTSGQFPAHVTQPVQYGPRIRAFSVYLRTYQLLPTARTGELLHDLFGGGPSDATVQTSLETCATVLAPVEARIITGLQQAPQAHFDESGFYVGGQRHWLHVSSTATLTHYGWHPKRGRAAMDQLGILPHFAGVTVHDGWPAYWHYGSDHALCNAHHLRELTFLEEMDHQAWAGDLKALLIEIKQRISELRATGGTHLPANDCAAFVHRYLRLLDAGDAGNPAPALCTSPKRGRRKQSKARNLLDRLRLHQDAVLRFMHDLRVPFDNNLAERDVRMLKVQQKISGCFRSAAGATAFCRIRSYLSTLRKQGQHVLTALEQALQGSPWLPPASA